MVINLVACVLEDSHSHSHLVGVPHQHLVAGLAHDKAEGHLVDVLRRGSNEFLGEPSPATLVCVFLTCFSSC